MKFWQRDAEEQLLILRKINMGATAGMIATMMQEQGYAVTTDSVQKKLKRIDEQLRVRTAREVEEQSKIAADEKRAAMVRDDFPLVDVPPDQFVGFRIAFFDIETTDLAALMGRILCWSIADNWGHITNAKITDFPQTSRIDDRGVCVALRDELAKYDIIIGWNSKMFDISMLNARLMRWGEAPLLDKMHVDPMWRAKAGSYGLRIGSAKLVNVSKFFDRDTGEMKTEIDWDVWAKASSGDADALDVVQYHCDQDVLVTRSVFNHLKPLIRTVQR